MSSATLAGDDLERKLYVVRRQAEKKIEAELPSAQMFYAPSFSCRTIVYKGLMMATQAGRIGHLPICLTVQSLTESTRLN